MFPMNDFFLKGSSSQKTHKTGPNVIWIQEKDFRKMNLAWTNSRIHHFLPECNAFDHNCSLILPYRVLFPWER